MMDDMIFQAPSSDPDKAVLIAKAARWRSILATRPIPRRGSLSDVRRDGDPLSESEWLTVATIIMDAVAGKDDDETVRVTFGLGYAEAVLRM